MLVGGNPVEGGEGGEREGRKREGGGEASGGKHGEAMEAGKESADKGVSEQELNVYPPIESRIQ